MMEVCIGGYGAGTHDEICYCGRNCPLCEALEKIQELSKEADTLNVEVDLFKEKSEEYYDLICEYCPEALI